MNCEYCGVRLGSMLEQAYKLQGVQGTTAILCKVHMQEAITIGTQIMMEAKRKINQGSNVNDG